MAAANETSDWESAAVRLTPPLDGVGVDDVITASTFNTKDYEQFALVLVAILFGVVTILGLVGNMLVIIVIAFNLQMRGTTNILIGSLAVADILFVIFCVPFTALRYVMSTWPFGSVCCKLHHYAINVTVYVSVYTLVLMSFDRYLAVVHAVSSMSIRTSRNARRAVAVTWGVIAAVNGYIPFEYDVVQYEFGSETRTDCVDIHVSKEVFDAMDAAVERVQKTGGGTAAESEAMTRAATDPAASSHARLLHGTFFAFAYVLPLTLICVLYGLMLHCFLRRGVGGVAGGGGGMLGGEGGVAGTQSLARSISKRRVTRMVVCVVLVFAICWTPIQVLFTCLYFGNISRVPVILTLQVIFSSLAYINSCLNPFLYAFLSDNFRQSFLKLLRCGRPHGSAAIALPAVTNHYRYRQTAGAGGGLSAGGRDEEADRQGAGGGRRLIPMDLTERLMENDNIRSSGMLLNIVSTTTTGSNLTQDSTTCPETDGYSGDSPVPST